MNNEDRGRKDRRRRFVPVNEGRRRGERRRDPTAFADRHAADERYIVVKSSALPAAARHRTDSLLF
jgi:hypothetical protein